MSDYETKDTLSMQDAWTLVEVLGTVRTNHQKVVRMFPEKASADRLIYAHARRIKSARGADIRDGFLEVTTREGMEDSWPIRELMQDFDNGFFRPSDWTWRA